MARTILLYGATGYSGRLIADELSRLSKTRPDAYRMVLAGRDAERVVELADALDMDYSVFALDDPNEIQRALGSQHANVLINAAGPFKSTALDLANAAIAQGCHYVDINGEIDVYQALDDLGDAALRVQVALVSGAGFWAAASNLLLDTALTQHVGADQELGAIRIAMLRIRTFSRGSAATVWNSLRQQAIVVRKGRNRDNTGDALMIWQEPVGKLERTFDFSAKPREPVRRIASAVSLVDTLAARQTLKDHKRMVRTIESYVEADLTGRVGYQLGAWLSPLVAIPEVLALVQQPVALLAAGPTQREREVEPHIVVLEIEDCFGDTLVDWHWSTPNVYSFTAQLVVGVAAQLANGNFEGWLTPAQVLEPLQLSLTGDPGPLRGCVLTKRRP
jgi:saccharopine dehydrogenase (NAD+, L-lysine-forming)